MYSIRVRQTARDTNSPPRIPGTRGKNADRTDQADLHGYMGICRHKTHGLWRHDTV